MSDDRPRGVLITRPAADAGPLAEMVAARGLDPVLAPLLEIRETGGAVTLDGVQALLLTSANGVRALASATPRRDLPVFAVGDATAAAARAAGFAHVQAADGDVGSLAALARDALDAGAGALLHVSGSDVAGDLAGDLAAHGFTVDRAVLYRAEAAETLPAAAREALQAGRIGAALFFSPRTARSFVKLAAEAGVGGACRGVAALCLSDAVADAVRGLDWSEARVADRPDLDALLACLDGWAAASNPEPEYRVTDKPEDDTTPWTEPAPKPEAKPAPDRPRPSTADGAKASAPGGTTASAATSAGALRRAGRGGIGTALTGFLAVLVLAGGSYIGWPFYREQLPEGARDALAPIMDAGREAAPQPANGALADRLTAVETALQALEERAAAAAGGADSTAALAAVSREIERLTGEVRALTDAQAVTAGRIDALEKARGDDAGSAASAALADRLKALETKIDAMAAAAAAGRADETAAALRDEAARRSAAAETRSAALEQAVARLSERLAAAEKNAGVRAGSAESAALLAATAELRTALRAGRGYAAALDSVRALAPDGATAALDALAKTAGTGVPTMDALRERFGPVAARAAQAALAPEGAGWLDQTLSQLSRLVTVRRVGPEAAADDSVTGRLAKAELRLAAGDLPGAVAALEGLTGKPAQAVSGWLADAKSVVAAEDALAAVNAEAIRRLGGGAKKGAAGG